MTWSIEQKNVWLAGEVVGEIVSNNRVRRSVKVFNSHGSAQCSTNCNNVDVIALFVHRFDFFVTKLGNTVVASIDEILIELRFFLKLSRRYQAQIDDNIVAKSRFVEDSVKLFEHLGLIVLRLNL